jgi:hypothetical protein
MSRRKKKPIQVISIALSLLMFGTMGLMRFTGSLGNNTSQDNPSPVSTTATLGIEDELVLNQTTSYRVQDGKLLALHYQGEAGQVVTMRVTSEHGVAPPMTILATIDNTPQTVIDVIPSLGFATKICGFIFDKTGAYTFTFDAPVSSTYSIQFDSGNTCDTD